MPKLALIRGLPGSGKSTFAYKNLPTYVQVEADQFFIKNGVYCYDSTKIREAHKYCYNTTKFLLELDNNVVVCNTFITRKEIKRYIDLLPPEDITIYQLHTMYGSIHNVPQNVMERKRLQWQNDLNFEGVTVIDIGK